MLGFPGPLPCTPRGIVHLLRLNDVALKGAEVTVVEGDRLDTIAARTLGDPEQYWRICDANIASNPPTLTAEPGRVLRVPVPWAEG